MMANLSIPTKPARKAAQADEKAAQADDFKCWKERHLVLGRAYYLVCYVAEGDE